MSVAIGSIAAGQTVTGETITGGTISNKGITLKDCTFTGQHIIKASVDMNLVIDGGKKVNDMSVTAQSYEGQFQILGSGVNWGTGRAGIIFRNFLSDGGSGDGIQMGTVRGVLVEDCEFRNHAQVDVMHADSIQVMDSQFVVIRGNWFHDNAVAVMMVDWNNSDNVFEDNLVTHQDGWDFCLSGVARVRCEHNTFVASNYGTRILDDHADNPPSNGYISRYNAYDGGTKFNVAQSGITGTKGPDLTNAVFKAPGDPGTRAGFQLATPANAPDGQVWGSRRLAGGITPPPPPPPTDKVPVARFTFSPAAPVIGQPVAFDGSASDVGDGSATFTWTDETSGAVYPLGTGSKLSFTFQQPGTKNVNLSVKDVDGDTNKVAHPVIVASAPPPPPPPPVNEIAAGDKVKITNPRSKYYGKTGTVNSVNKDTQTAMVAISFQFPLASLTEI